MSFGIFGSLILKEHTKEMKRTTEEVILLFSILFAEILILKENAFQLYLNHHVLLAGVAGHWNSNFQVRQNKEEITVLANLYSVIPKRKHWCQYSCISVCPAKSEMMADLVKMPVIFHS